MGDKEASTASDAAAMQFAASEALVRGVDPSMHESTINMAATGRYMAKKSMHQKHFTHKHNTCIHT
jgi:hypothetical protein